MKRVGMLLPASLEGGRFQPLVVAFLQGLAALARRRADDEAFAVVVDLGLVQRIQIGDDRRPGTTRPSACDALSERIASARTATPTALQKSRVNRRRRLTFTRQDLDTLLAKINQKPYRLAA
jgi:hypothetical protein